MKTMADVRTQLIVISKKLEDGKIDRNTAAELHKGIGAIISTVKAELAYSKLCQKTPKIAFMEPEK